MLNRRELIASSLVTGLLPTWSWANNDPAWKTTDARLRDAIVSRVGSGGRLQLPGGDYGMLHINLAFPVASPLVIAATDPSDPPRFSQLDVYEAENVTLERLIFDYSFSAGDELYYYPFRSWRSKNVSIKSCLFDGDIATGISDIDNGYSTGWGIFIRDSDGFNLENCELRGFLRGVMATQTSNLTILGNKVHSMRSEGLDFAEVKNAQIVGNTIYGFNISRRSKDHPDMVQFWTEGTSSPSQNVNISGNMLYLGNRDGTQSIFMRNELVDSGRAGSEMFYQNIVIENNFILNSHLHGITVGETNGLEVTNNTLVRDRAASGSDLENELNIPRINIKPQCRDVKILRNITAGIVGYQDQPDWKLDSNFIVQDVGRLRPNFYEAIFSGGNWSDPSSYRPRPGGPLDGIEIGAQLP